MEKGIAERSFIQYLDVDFNQTLSSSPPSTALQGLAGGLAGGSPGSYVELLWYGEGLNAGSTAQGSVNLFGAGTTAAVGLAGNDLSINFGAKGITGLLTETGVSGTGSPTSSFGDGWYALGHRSLRQPQQWSDILAPVLPLARVGDRRPHGERAVHGAAAPTPTPCITPKASRARCWTRTSTATGPSTPRTWPRRSPPTITRSARRNRSCSRSSSCSPARRRGRVTPSRSHKAQVRALMPEAIAAWQAAGLDAADVRDLEGVSISVGDLGSSILGLEAANAITINRTAAGYNWYVGAGAGSGRALGQAGPDGESDREPE